MSQFTDLLGGVTVFNLGLNVAGIFKQRNVALYILDTNTGKKKEILQPIENATLNKVEQITGLFGMSTVYMNAEISQNSRLMEHPVEDGTVCADYKVKMPTEITVRITLPTYHYKDILEEIQAYKDEGQMLYVETKFGSFKNMQIISIPVQLNMENVSRVTFSIRLKEVLLPMQRNTNKVANVKDSDTVKNGTISSRAQDQEIGIGELV